MKKSVLKKYARLTAEVGANIQKGQDVIIFAAVDQEDFVNYVVEECYKLKARNVTVRWSSDKVSKTTYKKESFKSLSYIPDWVIEREKYINKTLPAFIHILSEDPDGMKGVNQEKIAKVSMATYPIIKPLREERENKYQWTIVGAASPAWAKKVFPNDTKSVAMKKLWDAILHTARADVDDPIFAWKQHNDNFKNHCDYLNNLHLKKLHYTSKNGTDLTVGLLPNVNFLGGGETSLKGVFYNPNLPTEECFTSPRKGDAEGIVYSTKPLSYRGELIENFSIKFNEGKAVEVHAEKGEELLKKMITMDENAGYLGECALVPWTSPINQTGILFYNTLYDENACCHLALGAGFTNLVKGYENYTQQELYDMGINDSMIHVDFMIGSDDLRIVGTTEDDKEVVIFDKGVWAF